MTVLGTLLIGGGCADVAILVGGWPQVGAQFGEVYLVHICSMGLNEGGVSDEQQNEQDGSIDALAGFHTFFVFFARTGLGRE
jgi:hypothetical protein